MHVGPMRCWRDSCERRLAAGSSARIRIDVSYHKKGERKDESHLASTHRGM